MRSVPWVGSIVLIVVGGLVSYVGLPRQFMIGEATVSVPSVVAGLGLDISGGLMICGFVLLALQLDRWLNGMERGQGSEEIESAEFEDEELTSTR